MSPPGKPKINETQSRVADHLLRDLISHHKVSTKKVDLVSFSRPVPVLIQTDVMQVGTAPVIHGIKHISENARHRYSKISLPFLKR